MISRLAGFELEIIRRDSHAWWSLLCLAALVFLSFASTSFDAARDDSDKRAVAAAERARWLGQGTKDPHSAAHYSIFAFKPSPTLSGLDPGIGPFVGQSVWLEAHHQNDLLNRPLQNATLLQRAGLGNPASLLLTFAPLVVFLLAFVVVAQDRERGSLRLALGAASHPSAIIHAKALAIWGASTGLLVLPAVAAEFVLAAVGSHLSIDVFTRLSLWFALMAVYLALLSAIGIVVALRARDARIALAMLFGFWIVAALVLPRAGSSAADTVRPLPSSQIVRQQMLDEAAAYWTAEDTALHKVQLFTQYGVTRTDDIPNFRMAELDMVERHSHQVFDRILGDFYEKVASQDRLFSALGFLSPTIAVQSLSASLSGSDFSHHHDFIVKAEGYRRALVNRMNADGMAHRAEGDERHTNDERLWAQIPTFAYTAPVLGSATGTTLPALGALLLWLVGTWLLLSATARRLRP
ncbi:hypothetical protein GCM10007973_16390 [Polymorphobacter multimanifer]|uniref:ABC-2 type transport system permease protein n=1 Tax=Polymorphobacter multimanifer TaxID=1070431 RepID=A0A841LAR6_9SPHN|nr:DUF3526 domain-containing protein [Polymorphobacter multimanifer]MBB6229226.1 ABC-2 type transport system permease protein [Polymorphobacter multimanifer]GGI80650.1 hypothetical protein GCM10007973_16390 [Polymorphobacter multimanifer]